MGKVGGIFLIKMRGFDKIDWKPPQAATVALKSIFR
jgi:hypothetical protein